MKIIWGLYLFTSLSGIGFDSSHSLTNLSTEFLSKGQCIKAARLMNSGAPSDREVGMTAGIRMRYVCIAKPKVGQGV